MSTRLFLVRHAESVWNAEQRVQGQADPALSSLGRRQAEALATALQARPLSAIYTSPLQRAEATAAAIAAPHRLQPRTEPALREIDLGTWQGQHFDEIESRLPPGGRALDGDPALEAPGGESLAAAAERVMPALSAILSRHQEETIVLVTHSVIGRVALCCLLDTDLSLVPRLKLKLTSLSLLRIARDGAVLERLGDTSHLQLVRAGSVARAGDGCGTQLPTRVL